ncbi:MAG: CoA ester lyase [Burkholderiales bacterium]
MQPLTYLFVPGDRPDRFDKAAQAGAGAIVLDLEDAVLPAAKPQAREAICEWFARDAARAAHAVVRIASEADLPVLAQAGVRTVMLPKAESVSQVRSTVQAGVNVIALIETARGVRDVDAIAEAQGVIRLAFGTLDYAVDIGVADNERALLYPASRLVLASRCAGLPAPIAGVTTAIDDEAQLRADVAWERSLGFGAKLLVHPRQVAAVHAAMRPSGEDVAWARRIVAAAEAARGGAVQVDGRMVDRPVILKAQAILERIP